MIETVTISEPDDVPSNACICCEAGDTATVLVIEGEAEFHVYSLARAIGESPAEVAGWLKAEELPEGRFRQAYRVCEECAPDARLVVMRNGRTPEQYPVLSQRDD
jgi:hypothetical protein